MMWWRKPPNHSGNVGGDALPFRFGTDPIVGYRTWRVQNRGDGYALHSLMQSYVWRVDNTAQCLPSSMTPIHAQAAPHVDCACGIYAMLPDHSLWEWESHTRGRVRAFGQVALSGRIIRCERGYKAGQAQIVSPVTLEVNCAGLGSQCMGPVARIEITESSNDFWAWCPDHMKDSAREDPVMVEAGLWMRETVRVLSLRYDPVEFVSFL